MNNNAICRTGICKHTANVVNKIYCRSDPNLKSRGDVSEMTEACLCRVPGMFSSVMWDRHHDRGHVAVEQSLVSVSNSEMYGAHTVS